MNKSIGTYISLLFMIFGLLLIIVCLANELRDEHQGQKEDTTEDSSEKTNIEVVTTSASLEAYSVSEETEYYTERPQPKKCLLCDNEVSRSETFYCSTHDCGISNCSGQAKCERGCVWGQWCVAHSCQYPGCLGTPIGGAYYCMSHNEYS